MNMKYVYKIEVSLLYIIIEEVILIAFFAWKKKKKVNVIILWSRSMCGYFKSMNILSSLFLLLYM